MKNNLFVDLDGVLLDTARFVADFKDMLEGLGVSPKAIEAYYNSQVPEYRKYRSRTYYLICHAPEMKDILAFNDSQETRSRIDSLVNRLPAYLFSDALDFLETVKGENVFLVTYGGLKFQELKIANLGLAKYFRQIVITDGGSKTSALLDLQEQGSIDDLKGFFIDDRMKEISPVRSSFPQIVTIHLERTGFVSGDADASVSSLKQALSIIY